MDLKHATMEKESAIPVEVGVSFNNPSCSDGDTDSDTDVFPAENGVHQSTDVVNPQSVEFEQDGPAYIKSLFSLNLEKRE